MPNQIQPPVSAIGTSASRLTASSRTSNGETQFQQSLQTARSQSKPEPAARKPEAEAKPATTQKKPSEAQKEEASQSARPSPSATPGNRTRAEAQPGEPVSEESAIQPQEQSEDLPESGPVTLPLGQGKPDAQPAGSMATPAANKIIPLTADGRIAEADPQAAVPAAGSPMPLSPQSQAGVPVIDEEQDAAPANDEEGEPEEGGSAQDAAGVAPPVTIQQDAMLAAANTAAAEPTPQPEGEMMPAGKEPPPAKKTTGKPHPSAPVGQSREVSVQAVKASDEALQNAEAPAEQPFEAALDTAAGRNESTAQPTELVKSDENRAAASPLPPVSQLQTESKPAAPAAAPVPPPSEADFAETNHAQIVRAVKAELLPNGGTMQIRLDPPELGALQVRIEMRDNALVASFQTSNDDATRLLSHTLSQLKRSLESQGINVEKLQVQQAPPDRSTGNGREETGQQMHQDHSFQQEQQRRQMLREMWRRLSGDGDDLDLIA